KPFYNSVSFLTILIFFITASFNVTFPANGKITGKVTDAETGEVIPFANIVLTHKINDRGEEIGFDIPLGASTNEEGIYFILNVPPGVYIIKASVVGYASVVQKGVVVSSDRTIEVNFELSSSQIEIVEVVVTARRDIIKKDIAATQEIITSARLEQMPVTRVDEFVGRLKGVELRSDAEGVGIQIRGGAIRETDIRLDGISLQDPRTGSSYLAMNSTSIEETQVLTGGFQAKYGGVRAGIVNFVTKNGQREKYNLSLKADFAPKNQMRFFGTNPWSNDSWLYRVYAGEYAFTGTVGDTTVPEELRGFQGWARANNSNIRALDSLSKRELWLAQHPQYSFGDKPDIYLEGSLSGPIPGASIPIFGDFAERSTFLLAFKYENSQFAFPIGPRDNYEDMNGQFKLTTILHDNMRLSFNSFYSEIKTNGGGAASNFGALIGGSSSFSYFNNSIENVKHQARLINGQNIKEIFNKSRLQLLDKRTIFGGARFTHTFSNNAFYTVDFSVGYSDQTLRPFAMDTSIASNYVYYTGLNNQVYRFNVPQYGSPNAGTNHISDAMNDFRISGGTQRVDSSYAVSYQLKGDLTYQLGQSNQVETGFSIKLDDIFVYSGTWLQDKFSFTPDTWEYYKETPLEIGVYAQDKLEFEGMILTAGLRLDMLDPMKKSFLVQFPLDTTYQYIYNSVYQNLQGSDYERWIKIREYLDNPESVWPTTEKEIQVYLSPRVGVSFPVTEDSKLYFNYGHFYQRQAIQFLYKPYISPTSSVVPTPGLPYLRTVQYEFGFEQLLFSEFLINA
ncbi:MAG TPA: TonB-dependent receptor, partial [Ignavibacteriaceae bacterium]